MSLKVNYQKFSRHLETGGILYAVWRGIKYFIFFIKKHTANNVIFKGRLRVVCSDCGIKIFWDGNEVTKGAGLSVAINTLGIWTDSSKAIWHVLEKDKDNFKIKVVFRDLPISQVWRICVKDEQEISWQIDIDIQEGLHIDGFHIQNLVNPRYKTWVSNYRQGDFPRLDNNWHDLDSSNSPVCLVGVRFPLEGEFLPSFILEVENKNLFPLIQNLPLENNAHAIGFRHIDSEEKRIYPPGYYPFFLGKISLFDSDDLLDAKIERLRKDFLEAVIKEKAKGSKTERKLNVLLVNLPWQRNGKWGVRAGSRWPHIKIQEEDNYLPFPFFLAYTTSLLRKNDIEAYFIDAIAERIPVDKFIEKISRTNYDILIAETSTPSFFDDLRMLQSISSLGITIVLCGPHAEIYHPEFLREHSYIDFVLYGEYEFTALELIKNLQENKNLSKINGLIWRDGDRVVKNNPRPAFDINLLPWPHREVPFMQRYLDAPGEMPTPSVQIVASRGCAFSCIFCLWPQVMYNNNIYRTRNIIDVVDELEFLVRERGFRSVYFDDDTFNIGKERMLNFCRELKKRGLQNIPWAIMARPDLMDEEVLAEMSSAGLWAVKYGVESANQELLDNMKKNMNLKIAEKMIKFTNDLGIRTHLTFTFGVPGETKETIKETIGFALRTGPYSVQFSITTPFFGTKYFDILNQRGQIISQNWSDYDGNSGSVMKLEKVNKEELELAQHEAYIIWADYLRRKRRGLLGNIKRFMIYLRLKGLKFSIYKTIAYLNYIFIKKRRYLEF